MVQLRNKVAKLSVCLILFFVLINIFYLDVKAIENTDLVVDLSLYDKRDELLDDSTGAYALAGVCFAFESGGQEFGKYNLWQTVILNDGAGLNIGAMSANGTASIELIDYLTSNSPAFAEVFNIAKNNSPDDLQVAWDSLGSLIPENSDLYKEVNRLQRMWTFENFALKNIRDYNEKYDYLLRSPMLIEMVCSRTIHRGNATTFWEKTGISKLMTDEEIVDCVYDYEKNNFTTKDAGLQENIRTLRFDKEKRFIKKYRSLGTYDDSFITSSNYDYTNDPYVNARAGEIQGTWSSEVKEKMLSYGWSDYFGRSWALEEDNKSVLKTSNITWEDWRLNTKWKIPYVRQCFTDEFGARNVFIKDVDYTNSCHVFMSAYIASALDNKLINWAEMYAALRATDGIDSNGLFWTSAAYPTFNDLGIAWVGMNKYGEIIDKGSKGSEMALNLSGTAQDKLNYILDNGGIVGITGNSNSEFAGRVHFFVVTERNENNMYKIYSTCYVDYDSEWISWDRLWGENGSLLRRDLGDGSQFYLAYKFE